MTIAAITSCTNTSNPSVMIGAALLAKKAVERGLSRKPWVKTTLAPGSKVVSDYYDRAGLTPYLDKLGFNLVGYGCTTCIGNSGPLIPEVSAAVNEADLAVTAVLSGNRNFEGRINPDIKMNYLASPPLVVAYALAGTMDIDLYNEPLGTDPDGNAGLPARHLAEHRRGRGGRHRLRSPARCSSTDYADVFAGDERWQSLPTPQGQTFAWDPDSTYVRKPPYFDGMQREPSPVTDISGARVLVKLGDSVTTDHISPAGSIRADSPAGKYLAEHGVERKDFNSYGSRRGNHEVMIRGTFANIRLRNQIAPGTEGGFTRDFTGAGDRDDAPVTTIYDASVNYAEAGTPLVILAGKEYGSGSSRDWAAKGTALLGVRAVIAESYERIHRSNLIGMGVLPLQYPEGRERRDAGPDRHRDLRHHRGDGAQRRRGSRTRSRSGPPRREWRRAVDLHRDGPDRHPRRGRVLPARRHHAVRAALAARLSRRTGHRIRGRIGSLPVQPGSATVGRRSMPASAFGRALSVTDTGVTTRCRGLCQRVNSGICFRRQHSSDRRSRSQPHRRSCTCERRNCPCARAQSA